MSDEKKPVDNGLAVSPRGEGQAYYATRASLTIIEISDI
jgi:hypothetical protein